MIKGKKESKLLIQINEDRDINRDINIKKKKKCDFSKHSKKMNMKQKVKQKNINKSQKVTKKLSVQNMFLKCNEDTYKYQIEQLNLMFKQSLKYPTLTQDELYMLFAKYKSDGHYRTNKNLPPFTSLLVNTHNMFKEKNHFYEQFPDMHLTSNGDTTENLYFNTLNKDHHIEENSKVSGILQSDVKQDLLKYAEIAQVNKTDNKIQNKYFYNDQNFITSNNCNHMCMNYNVQSHSKLNMLNNIQNFAQSNSNTKKISDSEQEYFLCNSIALQNIISEGHQNCRYVNKNLLCNVSDSDIQYEMLTNSNEASQKNGLPYSVQYNNFSLNPNFSDDFYLNTCNNITSIDKNSNYQSLKNVQSICIPQITNLESCFNVKNSVAPRQLSLIKNHLEEQDNFNLPVRTDTYSVVNNKTFQHISNDDVYSNQQDFNAYNANSVVMPNGSLSETNAFIANCTNVIDQCN